MKNKRASIWIVQADHLSGESLGSVIETLLDLGAKNVHIVPTITKKNRPGHIMLIDIANAASAQEIETYLVEDLGIYGHHRLVTEHYHEITQVIERPVTVKTSEGEMHLNARLKIMSRGPEKSFPRMEHDSLVAVQREIRSACGANMSLREITSVVESAVHQGMQSVVIVINGCHRKISNKGGT